MPPITEDQIFPSLLAFKTALREWAIETNFTPHILDSDSHRVRAGCRSSPTCPFRIRCNWNDKRNHARVTTCEDVHNCVSATSGEVVVHQNIKRAETGRLKFLVEAVPQLLDVSTETTTTAIIEAVEGRYGQRIPLRQAQKVKRELAGRIHGPCRYCRAVGHSKRNCAVRKEREAAAGTMAPPPPRPVEMEVEPHYDYGGDSALDPQLAAEEQHASPRCPICFQPGHSRTNCPSDTIPSNDGPSPNYTNGDSSQQPAAYAIPYSPVDNLNHHSDIYGTSALQTPTPSRPHHPTMPTDPNLTDSTPRTPKEIRTEASRLMQQAAKLMSEAAAMQAEAARLTALVDDA
ncbi:MAG: hypothetical protein Q9183_003115 [Haloplaca sp. 2 TL-2023]